MTFKLISPQKIKHSSGYILQGRDRYSLEYIEGHKTLVLPVDDRAEPDYVILWEKVSSWEKPFETPPLSQDRLNEIRKKVQSALSFEKI